MKSFNKSFLVLGLVIFAISCGGGGGGSTATQDAAPASGTAGSGSSKGGCIDCADKGVTVSSAGTATVPSNDVTGAYLGLTDFRRRGESRTLAYGDTALRFALTQDGSDSSPADRELTLDFQIEGSIDESKNLGITILGPENAAFVVMPKTDITDVGSSNTISIKTTLDPLGALGLDAADIAGTSITVTVYVAEAQLPESLADIINSAGLFFRTAGIDFDAPFDPNTTTNSEVFITQDGQDPVLSAKIERSRTDADADSFVVHIEENGALQTDFSTGDTILNPTITANPNGTTSKSTGGTPSDTCTHYTSGDSSGVDPSMLSCQ